MIVLSSYNHRHEVENYHRDMSRLSIHDLSNIDVLGIHRQ